MKNIKISVAVFSATCLILGFSNAQPFLETSYESSIPTLSEVVGHDHGEEITTPAETIKYFETLAEAAPDKIKITKYAKSWEERDLVYAAIGSPDNIARLDEIKQNLSRLNSDVSISSTERDRLVSETPAVVWLSYGVHGDEISSTDAGILLTYHLLAAPNDPVVSAILSNTIVIIDPMQNPDGRARFVQSFEAARGATPQSDRYAAEHDQPWPGGRFNHYLFDMNRDWFALTQPETRGRVENMQPWHPVVVVDAHEMGGDQTYFFAPAAEPFNPHITAAQRAKQTIIGRNHARWFDDHGIEFFTREIFDAFYPGYGDTWPALNGAVSMTYEQASARGLVFKRRDGRTLTYSDGVKAHFISTLSTAEAVANNKTAFLSDYSQFRKGAGLSGGDGRFYVFDLAVRRGQSENLARQLSLQGIEVHRLTGSSRICGRDFPNGALVVDSRQPTGNLVHALLSKDTPLPPDFVTNQESRRDRGLGAEIYDVTAWSLPLMYGVTSIACGDVNLTNAATVRPDDPISPINSGGDAAFGYAVPWSGSTQAQFIIAALKNGLKAKSSDEGFRANGRDYPRGTVIFSRALNDENYDLKFLALAQEYGAETWTLPSSWVEAGPNFGSSHFKMLKLPKVALVWGEGTQPTEAGAARYVLERRLGFSVTPIRARTISRADLSLYDVLVLPTGRNLAAMLGAGGASSIAEFVAEGGVAIGFGNSVGVLAGENIGLLSTAQENAWTEPGAGNANNPGNDDEAGLPGSRIENTEEYLQSIAPTGQSPDYVPGVLVNTRANTDHWLSAGYNDGAVALLSGSEIYAPLSENDGLNVFHFAGSQELLASGYLWEENRRQLAFKPLVMVQQTGNGFTIGFTQSPVTRGYLGGLDLLLANAILLGPAQGR